MRYFIVTIDAQDKEKVYFLKESLVVGRSPECHILLDLEGVSRRHCLFRREGNQVLLEDLESTNGTFLNGTKVKEAVVRLGDWVVVGAGSLQLLAGNEALEGEGHHTQLLGQTTIETLLRKEDECSPDPQALSDADLEGRSIEALFKLTEGINATRDRDALLGNALTLLTDLFQMDFGGVFQEATGGAPPKPVLTVNNSDSDRYSPSTSVISQVLKENVSVIATDLLESGDISRSPSIVGSGTACIMCVPMGPPGQMKCAIYLSSQQSRGSLPRVALQLLKSMSTQIGLAMENLTHLDRLKRDNLVLRTALPEKGDLVGSSSSMERIRNLVKKVAVTEATVLIRGESGTGKEVVANAIHRCSRRGKRPLVSINCGAIPESTVESELFGHEKGAFTGATERKIGKFELAAEGTLFLDEIGELSPSNQVKLLRALENKAFYRVGGESLVEVDVRILAATNADLEERERKGAFRKDLLYRLKVFTIDMPPLKEHLEDLPELTRFFLRLIGGDQDFYISQKGMERLRTYPWPGNVRELRNLLERETILAEGLELGMGSLEPPGSDIQDQAGPATSLKEAEKLHIIKVLEVTGWNKKRAAEILGIGRPTLYDRMKQYGIENRP